MLGKRSPSLLTHAARNASRATNFQQKGTAMSFRENLQYLRASKNLTQEQLAVLLGVSRQSVTKWEAERSYPEMDKLLKLCQLFDCSLDDLVQGNVAQAKAKAESGKAETAANLNSTDAASAKEAGAVARDASIRDGASSKSHGSASESPHHNADGNAHESTSHAVTSVVAKPEDVTGYDAHWREFARKIATGICLCAASVVAPVLAYGPDNAGAALGVPAANLAVFVMFALIALGVSLIIPAAISHKQFRKEHPFVIDFYTLEERRCAARALGQGIVTGIACVLAGSGFCILAASAVPGNISSGVVLMCIAVGAALITHSAILRARTNVEAYNAKSAGVLSEGEINALTCDDERKQEHMRKAGARVRKTRALCGAIMLAATVIGLVWMFAVAGTGQSWGYNLSSMFWLSWVVGALTCGVVCTLRNTLP